jgi:hypothetical protein
MATKKIKLTCTACSGELVYDHDGASSQDAAHARLHGPACAYKTAESRISYVAEHGQPVESEAIA